LSAFLLKQAAEGWSKKNGRAERDIAAARESHVASR
jgi:NitT/TauT family transport system substrate-binding protein